MVIQLLYATINGRNFDPRLQFLYSNLLDYSFNSFPNWWYLRTNTCRSGDYLQFLLPQPKP